MATAPQPTSWLTSRAAAVAVIVAACAVTAVALCGPNLMTVASVACFDGLCAAAWVGGATALGDVLLRACRVRATGPLRVATAGGLGMGLFSLVGLGLGLLGALNRPVAVAFPIVGYLLLGTDVARRGVTRAWGREAVVGWLRRPAGGAWLWAVPAVSLTMAAVAAAMMPGILWKPLDPHPYDVTSYHLQVPREWYEAGRIVPLRHNMFSYFPMNAEMQSLLLMHAAGGPRGPWTAMYACQFVSVGYTLLMVLAAAGAIGEGERSTSNAQRSTSKGDRDGRWTLSVERWTFAPPVAAAMASVVPWVVMLAGVAYVESALMCYTALAVAWALRATDGGAGFVKPLVVAGVMAGLACGVKITAVPMLLLAVPVAVVVAVGRSVPWRTLAVGCCAFVVAGSIVGSPWLVRNVAWAGNPLWPVGMSVLGRGHFSAEQVERFKTAHSPRPDQRSAGARLGILWRDVLAHWQYGYVLLPAAAVAAALRWRDRQTRLLVVTAIVVLIVWFGFTHLLARFMVMAVPIAAVLVGRASAGRWWPAGVAVAVLAAAFGWAGVGPVLAEKSRSADYGPFFGLTDFGEIIAEAKPLADAVAAGKQVGVVGDAQAFFYQVPMSRLHYRTVFDLPGDTPDPVAAWVGREAEGNANWLLVVNPAEVARLHATYRFTPALPADWAARGPGTFLLPGNALTTETRRHGEEIGTTDAHR